MRIGSRGVRYREKPHRPKASVDDAASSKPINRATRVAAYSRDQRPLLAQGRAAMAKGRTGARLIRKDGREHRGRQWMRNFRNLGLDMASRPFNKGWAMFCPALGALLPGRAA